MTSLLERAIDELRRLPSYEQDEAAHMLLAFVGRDGGSVLTEEEQREVDRTLAGLDDGSVRVLSDEEAEALWKRLGA